MSQLNMWFSVRNLSHTLDPNCASNVSTN